MIRGAKDFWAGVIYIGFGVSALLLARDYPMGTAVKMGPAYFPTLLSGLLIFIGVIAVGRALVIRGAPVGALAGKSLSLIVASILLFGFVVRGLGVAVSLPLLVIMSAWGSRLFRWPPILALAVGITVACVLIFIKGLGIPLPVWGSWLAW